MNGNKTWIYQKGKEEACPLVENTPMTHSAGQLVCHNRIADNVEGIITSI